ncbi:hypothetical protein F4678DRAFT_432161 [Xylaria arbuscula]|nr:hypothetical protein F4678DRAFT_432161 [Xylaria arbuscula]
MNYVSELALILVTYPLSQGYLVSITITASLQSRGPKQTETTPDALRDRVVSWTGLLRPATPQYPARSRYLVEIIHTYMYTPLHRLRTRGIGQHRSRITHGDMNTYGLNWVKYAPCIRDRYLASYTWASVDSRMG